MHRTFSVFLLILVISGLLVAGCSSSKALMPEVKVEGANLTSISLTDLTLDVILSVDNPNPVGITLKSLSFDVNYKDGEEWKYLSHGEQTGIRIDPGKNVVTVPVTVKTTDVIGADSLDRKQPGDSPADQGCGGAGPAWRSLSGNPVYKDHFCHPLK